MKELLISSILGVAVLGFDILKLRKFILPLIALSLLAIIACVILDWGKNEIPFSQALPMLVMDKFALSFIGVLSSVALLWFLFFYKHYGTDSRKTDLFALVVFSLCGAMVMVSYTNLVMLFLGIEILSIPLYVLAASKRNDIISNESGFKYFFLGSLASAILLFGIALVYGATGSFDLSAISSTLIGKNNAGGILSAGIIMMIAGFAFKVSVAPFHQWAPDVYQGAPTPVTALMATVVKGAAFASLLRLFALGFAPLLNEYADALAVLSALTLIVANVVALNQTNAKRLLAYSSISHAGFMLGAIIMMQNGSSGALLFYVVAYSIASLVAFVVMYHVSSIQNGYEDLEAFKGLVKRNPVMAGAMTLALLSMAGIPPLSGFLAKYFIISGLIQVEFTWLAIIMILTSAVAVYYYLRLIILMFTPIENAGRIMTSNLSKWLLIILSLAMVGLFFGASWFYGLG